MKLNLYGPSLAATVATWLALGLLGALIVAIAIALFPVSESLARQNPEFSSLQAPLLVLALGLCLCVVVILITTAALVGFIRRDRIFGRSAALMVDVLIITVIVATFVTAWMLAFIPGPPVLAILIMGGVLVGITLALVLMVLRSLLRQTAFMRAELNEVV
ncbi:MAG: DUF2975 domain-containing protein [Lacisediminihabitans sp.]